MNSAVVIFSSGKEWNAAKEFTQPGEVRVGPYGEWFELEMAGWRLQLLHGGWGKVAAAASAEFALSTWRPDVLINLGTCGGFKGRIEREEVVLVERTLIYDIIELMGDPAAAIQRFTVDIDLSWLREPYPMPVRKGLMVSADRDILAQDIPGLIDQYGATAGDWESGAIAWVAARRGVRCLILRGVSDLVGAEGGEAYGNIGLFVEGARRVTWTLLENLPAWLERIT